ncbi:SurA N-terminal domain-containing protein [Candidatus Woesearchaeota archaeon]|nr:SurA N-terminal domain-containing protein [Candidatus Woesearchaeota archaeon]
MLKIQGGFKIKKKKTRGIKKKTIKKISAVVVLVAVLAVVLYFAFATLKPAKAIATVNGEAITNRELEDKYNRLPDEYKLFISKEDFLDQIINVKLLLQEAREQAVVVSEDEIDFEINTLKKQAPTEKAFEELLKQQDTTLNELKEQLHEQLTINKLLDHEVVSKIEVSESKVLEYYKDNQDYFDENDIPYSEAKEDIRNILLNDLSSNVIDIYINQLRSDAVITKDGIKVTSGIETFTRTDDSTCKKEGKVIIRLFSSSKNSASRWISRAFDDVADEYGDEIIAYHWQLDTGDNTLTSVEETGVPKAEVDVFRKYNPENTVPTYIFGCKYVRVGNSYSSLEEEKAEFRRVIEKFLV